MKYAAAKSALLGFSACTIFALVLYLAAVIAATFPTDSRIADIVKSLGDSESEARAFLIEHGRWNASENLKMFLFFFLLYWLPAGLLGKGPLLRSRSANILFALAITGMLLIASNGYFGWSNTVCDELSYPHEGFQIFKIHECPSSQIFFGGLTSVSILLLFISLVTRIIGSGKATRASQ